MRPKSHSNYKAQNLPSKREIAFFQRLERFSSRSFEITKFHREIENFLKFSRKAYEELFREFEIRCPLVERVLDFPHGKELTVDPRLTRMVWHQAGVVAKVISDHQLSESARRVFTNIQQSLWMIEPEFQNLMVFAEQENASQLWEFSKEGFPPVGTTYVKWNLEWAHADGKKAEKKIPFEPTQSQESALQLLEYFHRLKQEGGAIGGVFARPIPLIIGPSGVGKTAVVKAFADRHKLPLLMLNASWSVQANKDTGTTPDSIRDFIRRYEKGVIFIDEVDKFGAQDHYTVHMRQELFALLDTRTRHFGTWVEADHELFPNFMLIGAGTWQELRLEQSNPLGFINKSVEEVSARKLLQAQYSIPEELLFRFNDQVIVLESPTRQEFSEKIVRIREKLGLTALPPRTIAVMVEEAYESRKQYRWLETYLTQLQFEKFEAEKIKKTEVQSSEEEKSAVDLFSQKV